MKPPAVERTLRTLPQLTDAEVASLGQGEVLVRDHAFGAALSRSTAAALEAWHHQGRLTPAGIGRAGRPSRARGDLTCWVDPDSPELAGAFALFEGLRLALASSLRLGLQRFALQAARYEAGAGYAPHVDAFRGDPSRIVTAIWYLNADWQPGHGGQLRAHLPDGLRDIEPVADRLVIFLSEAVRHEVLPAHAPRMALTAWYRGAEAIPLLPDPVTGWGAES